MNGIQIFKNEEFGEIRTLEINGQIYFVGVDVAKALGYAKPRNAIAKYVSKDDSLKWGVIDNLGRTQQTIIINESGVYSLVMSSKLPDAKNFQHWVTSEVLPSIRRTGSYRIRSLSDETLYEKLEMLEQKIDALNKRIAIPESNSDIKTIVTTAVEMAVSETVNVLTPYIQLCETHGQTTGKIQCQPRNCQNSKMLSLPQNVRRQVDEMIISGRYSCQKISDFITANTGISISYMTVSRYIKKYFKV